MSKAADTTAVLDNALSTLKNHAPEQTDGIWLEELTAAVAPLIRDWNIDGCWWWGEWPDRDTAFPDGLSHADLYGIDLVARRRDDGKWIAIQCKSRKLDEQGQGNPIPAHEIDTFLSGSANARVWAERWLVVNGAVALSGNAPDKAKMSGVPLKVVNVAQAVETQRAVLQEAEQEPCPHCETTNPDDRESPIQTKTCMQQQAVTEAVAKLRAHESTDEDGIPRGEARGRIVLPCGTGKTRIALRITEQLTYPGELSVVLCPSIALVAQIRREFLQHTNTVMRAMAVCSDKGVAADEESVVNKDDATLDRGMATTEEIKGCLVTTDSTEIADWIRARRDGVSSESISVIFGTYQSAQRIAAGIKGANAADGFKVLICDEAHRTAGVRRKKRTQSVDDRLREFTLCHDSQAFPATYRVYQTATPKIYSDTAQAAGRTDRGDFVVRHMDDQQVFGVVLFRRSYADAVRNGWLSDYRIIALAVGGTEATAIANLLVQQADEQAAAEAEASSRAAAKQGRKVKARGRRADRLPTTGDYLKGMGFALAMGGAALAPGGGSVPIRSCIGFLNTIARSKTMSTVLQSDAVKEWVAKQAADPAPTYQLEHLDASASVARRDEAKRRLAVAATTEPHGVLNVGIFGEGTDSPSLSAVAFLEPRRSPIDVVQAVGRAMRRSVGKDLGYIIVPVVIPPGVDAETHLAISDKHEGWRELGEILQALRAHDKRIEDALPEILTIQLPQPEQLELKQKTVVAVGRPDKANLEYAVVTGSRGRAEDTARAAAKQGRSLFDFDDTEPFTDEHYKTAAAEPDSVIVHIKRDDGTTETRQDTVARHKPKPNEDIGPINPRQTKRRAAQMSNGQRGRVLPDPKERARIQTEREAAKHAAFEEYVQGVLLDLSERVGDDISMNLLEKSGLTANPVARDLNLLSDAIGEAGRYLRDEAGLAAELDAHFGFDQLAAPKAGKPRADGATVAALLWMNAAMLHQRVRSGGWLGRKKIDSLADINSSTTPERGFRNSWQTITRQDFLPVLEPAMDALDTAEQTDRLGGLRRALRHLATEAEQIAETYAEMGTDHAGALFNKVMGDQSSDGAFFTRPVPADIAARLAFDAVDPDNTLDWSNPDVWRDHKTVDLACGSGTLLAASMAEMKRRAVLHDADRKRLAELQKVAVEEILKGLDINPVSLQLAATQLMAGNTDIKYRKMGLHLMPYGPQPDGSVSAGTPELFARSELVAAQRLFDDAAMSATVKTGAERVVTVEGPEMDDATAAARDARIVIMNPPFTNRTKMGEKFDTAIQQLLRHRMDTLEGLLAAADPRLCEFLDKNSLRPRFAALADLCLDKEQGVFATVLPTIALTNASGLVERQELAKRFHVHTILTCHQHGNINLSQNTNINESIVVLRRHPSGDKPPTRIIALDRQPADDNETDQLFKNLDATETGSLPDGWGEVSTWPAERIDEGDWTAAVWRSPTLAVASAKYTMHDDLTKIEDGGGAWAIHATPQLLRADYRRAAGS